MYMSKTIIEKGPMKLHVKGTAKWVRHYLISHKPEDVEYEDWKYMIDQYEFLIRADQQGIEIV